jgi:hypothetical protein
MPPLFTHPRINSVEDGIRGKVGKHHREIIDNSGAYVNGLDKGHAEVPSGSGAEVGNYVCDVCFSSKNGRSRHNAAASVSS